MTDLKTKRKPTGAAAMGAGPGRPKGCGNKKDAQLKEMILGALDKAGGTEYLLGCAKDPKLAGAFLSLIGKVLPMTVQGPGENGEHIIKAIERQIVKARN
jgi:hypothetical protein